MGSPSGVRGDKRQTIWCILESKSAALVAAVFVGFPNNKCNFLHRNDPDIVRRDQFLAGRRPARSFSRGAVATVALWKSAAPIARRGLGFTATARHRDPTTWNLAPAADC